MSLDENPWLERLRKMPAVTAGFALLGMCIGAGLAAVVVFSGYIISIRARFWIFCLITTVGFCLGTAIGVVLDTLVFKPRRDKREKRERRRRRKQEQKKLNDPY
jgi:hypothetical protein